MASVYTVDTVQYPLSWGGLSCRQILGGSLPFQEHIYCDVTCYSTLLTFVKLSWLLAVQPTYCTANSSVHGEMQRRSIFRLIPDERRSHLKRHRRSNRQWKCQLSTVDAAGLSSATTNNRKGCHFLVGHRIYSSKISGNNHNYNKIGVWTFVGFSSLSTVV